MASNEGPVYGRQSIRYTETFHAPANFQVPGVDAVEVGEFRAVAAAGFAGPGFAAAPDAFTVFPTAIVGVNQAYVPLRSAEPAHSRVMTVATSGLLLMENADGAAGYEVTDIGAALAINALGQASEAGTLVTSNGTTPRIREVLNIGGRHMVLVSFS